MSDFNKDWAAILKKRAKALETLRNKPVAKWPQAESHSKEIKPKVKAPEPEKVKAPELPKPKAPKTTPQLKVRAASRTTLQQTPVKGPKSAFRMSPAPSADELARLRNQ
jgi:hypothetical protein